MAYTLVLKDNKRKESSVCETNVQNTENKTKKNKIKSNKKNKVRHPHAVNRKRPIKHETGLDEST